MLDGRAVVAAQSVSGAADRSLRIFHDPVRVGVVRQRFGCDAAHAASNAGRGSRAHRSHGGGDYTLVASPENWFHMSPRALTYLAAAVFCHGACTLTSSRLPHSYVIASNALGASSEPTRDVTGIG